MSTLKRIPSVLAAVVLAVTMAACGGSDPAAQSQSAALQEKSTITVPILTGMTGRDAKDALEKLGLVAEFDGGERMVLSPKNWTVDGTDPAGGTEIEAGATIIVKAHKVEDENEGESESVPEQESGPMASNDLANSQGLTGYTARMACSGPAETTLKNMYPGSKIKVYDTMGLLAQDLRDDDRWFIKFEAKVDSNMLNVECVISGTEDAPVVDEANAY